MDLRPPDQAGPLGLPIDPGDLPTRAFLALARLLRCYHRHQIVHLARLGRVLDAGRRVVLVGNHALDIVDPLLFVAAVYERHGRVPRFIGQENLLFRTPGLRELVRHWSVIPSRHMEETAEALARDGFLMLFPGSGTEAVLRVYREEPYRLKWEGRTGFLRLALEHDADILFVAAVGNEEMYYQTRLPIPDPVLRFFHGERYRGARLLIGLTGPHVIPAIFPLPVEITHVVSPPLDLGDRSAARDPEALAALHRRVWRDCQTFLDRAVARVRRRASLFDRTVRGAERMLQHLGL